MIRAKNKVLFSKVLVEASGASPGWDWGPKKRSDIVIRFLFKLIYVYEGNPVFVSVY